MLIFDSSLRILNLNPIKKTKKVRENLDKPFNIMSIIEEENRKGGFFDRKTNPQEYEWADKIEGNIKQTLKVNNIKWG